MAVWSGASLAVAASRVGMDTGGRRSAGLPASGMSSRTGVAGSVDRKESAGSRLSGILV